MFFFIVLKFTINLFSSEQNHNSSTSNRQYNRRELNEQEEIGIFGHQILSEDAVFRSDSLIHQINCYF